MIKFETLFPHLALYFPSRDTEWKINKFSNKIELKYLNFQFQQSVFTQDRKVNCYLCVCFIRKIWRKFSGEKTNIRLDFLCKPLIRQLRAKFTLNFMKQKNI
jgi:hypothetical protein